MTVTTRNQQFTRETLLQVERNVIEGFWKQFRDGFSKNMPNTVVEQVWNQLLNSVRDQVDNGNRYW
jgi:hypothetical protein